MELNKFIKGDVFTSPFTPQTKHISAGAAILGGAAIGGLGNIFGGLFGKSSANSTNRTNLQIAQMNNEFNEKMLDKQLAFNQDMFDQQIAYDDKKWRDQLKQQMMGQSELSHSLLSKQLRYNSAGQQKKRLIEAGLNPYLMMNGGNAGVASSQGGQIGTPSGGAPSALGVNPPTASEVGRQMQDNSLPSAISGAAGIIQTMLDNLAQKDVRASQSGLNIANTKTIDALRDLQVEGMTFDNLNKQRDKWLKDNQLFLDNITFPDLLRQRHAQTNMLERQVVLTEAQVLSTQLQAALNSKELQSFDQKLMASMAVMAAQANELIERGFMNKSAAINYVANASKLQAETDGIIVNNDVLRRSADFLVSTAKHNKNKSLWDTNLSYQTWRNKNFKDYAENKYTIERAKNEIRRGANSGFNINLGPFGKLGFDFLNYK